MQQRHEETQKRAKDFVGRQVKQVLPAAVYVGTPALVLGWIVGGIAANYEVARECGTPDGVHSMDKFLYSLTYIPPALGVGSAIG